MLKRVIGQVADIIRVVLRVNQATECPHGGSNNTVKVQPQHVPQVLKPKRKVAQQDKSEPSPSKETSRAQTRTKRLQGSGIQQPTLAKQPAKSKPKAKRSVALPTIVAPLHKHARQVAQATNGDPGKQPKTPASKTRQHVKSKVKAKP